MIRDKSVRRKHLCTSGNVPKFHIALTHNFSTLDTASACYHSYYGSSLSNVLQCSIVSLRTY